jgi:hypothetical protein
MPEPILYGIVARRLVQAEHAGQVAEELGISMSLIYLRPRKYGALHA